MSSFSDLSLRTPLDQISSTVPDVPPPPPSAPRASTAKRPPLQSARTVSVPLAEQFQRRHALEFAHLHSTADNSDLQAEQMLLDAERRIGRMKRESRIDPASTMKSERATSVDGSMGRKNGPRPLSLVQKRVEGHVRSKTADIGLGIDFSKAPTNGRDVYPKPRTRPGSISVMQRPRSLRSSFVTTGLSSRPDHIPEDQPLEVLVERDGSPAPETGSSEGDQSFSTSTYSWATSFSGETTDLRTAAHYVPSRAQTPDIETQVELDSPARKEQRRKRIVAIAHTVRQLEGVGSRDLEDPTFYNVLQKAWYERFDDKQRAQLGSPVNLQTTQNEYGPASSPYTYEAESSTMGAQRVPYIPPGASPADQWTSPPDPEFRTPVQGYEPHPDRHDYPRPQSTNTSTHSRSVRYSYASTLHDLALDGMMQQGTRLMKEKAWMRPTSMAGTPWGGDFDMPPPLRAPTPEEEEHLAETPSTLDSPFEFDHPHRAIRHMNGTVYRPEVRRVVSDEKPSLESPARLPAQGEAGPSTWGLGFVSAWWDNTPAASQAATPDHPARHGREDFRFGEDGNIPKYQKRERKRSMTMTTPSSSMRIRMSGSSSIAVLEPDHTTTDSTNTTLSLSPSDRMFIDALIRVPSRRRSCIPNLNRRSTTQRTTSRSSHSTTRTRFQARRRALSVPITPQMAKAEAWLIDGTSESAFSNRYLVKCMPTHSITSSPLPPAPPPSCQRSEEDQEEETQRSDQTTTSGPMQPEEEAQEEVLDEEDGSIGSEILSLRSISPWPTPPLDNDMYHYPQPNLIHPPLPTLPEHPAPHVPFDLTKQRREDRRQLRDQDIPEHGQLVPWPVPHVSTSTWNSTPSFSDRQALAYPPSAPQAIQTRSSSLHPSSNLYTSPPSWLDRDTASIPQSAIHPLHPLPDRLSRSELNQTQFDDVPEEAIGVALTCGDTPPIEERASPLAQVEMAMAPTKRYSRPLNKWLFFIGFICPILWLIGGWPTKKKSSDVEKAGEGGQVMMATKLEQMSWYRRWTWHPDPYVERCRWAAGVTVPVCLIGGVTAAILVAALR